ncbi:hypothetical protein [Pseudomonas sp. Gutcm_11s]|uniref:hypothetical protein n=1 Tax=Pseudomonas sp. Gutcm_11s TaxID=3026088 RepID=UPI0023601602|nr:hypothetical protein [Pseudomonas sp. Gutcm_11s]MDD0841499.1 hypothetical protein [Pseudomonas sp. Gutcm_11s]
MKKHILLFTAMLASQSSYAYTWQEHLEWSSNDDGAKDCPTQYTALGGDAAQCPNRECLMVHARTAASNNNYGRAFQIVLVTQCHNKSAQQSIQQAGQKKVGDWLVGIQ